jgi:hypothetical protein
MEYQDTTRDKLAHTPGAPRGEAVRRSVNRFEDDATGINVEDRKPIDARMPHMPPA